MAMTESERLTYAEMAIRNEMERIGDIHFFSAEIWEEKFMSRPDVDPLNVHKQYGLTTPQIVKNDIVMGFSAAHLIRPMADYDDNDFSRWISYWILHLGLHVVILSWAVELGETGLSLEEIERRVDSEYETQGRDLFAFGEQVKLLTTT